MKKIILNIKVGNEVQCLSLKAEEWRAVQSGVFLIKREDGLYEGQSFSYVWHFNDPKFPQSTLVVTYDDGEGFIGSISDAWFTR